MATTPFSADLERGGTTSARLRVPVDLQEPRAAAGVDAHDRLGVTPELVTEPRTVSVPDDLRSALARDPEAEAPFDPLSCTHRREYVERVAEARAGRHR